MNVPKSSWLTFACLTAASVLKWLPGRLLLLACAVLSLRWTGRLGKDEEE